MTKKIAAIILGIWLGFMILATSLTFATQKPKDSRHYAKMMEAATLAKNAMQAIKQYKLNNGISIPDHDILSTGMIGEQYSEITTTSGVLEAKRTSTNPDWAAVFIDMFVKSRLKAGDQVGMIFSGSFPALSISALAAAEVYGLKTCVMASIGASSYGANQADFTLFDMVQYLTKNGYLAKGIDYVSWGGDNDDGWEFFLDFETTANQIQSRIDKSDVVFIKESDFSKNIDLRIGYFRQIVPQMKFLMNIGGNIIGAGKYPLNFTASGYIAPDFSKSSPNLPEFLVGGGYGLLDYYHLRAMPVANILNIERLGNQYGIAFDPVTAPQLGSAGVYKESNYNLVFAITAIGVSIAILICYYIYRKKTGFKL